MAIFHSIPHCIIVSILLKMATSVPLPQESIAASPVSPIDRQYDGSESFLGGLIGGGVAALLGGLLGPEFGATFSAFGGAMGGGGGSAKEAERNGMSVLGGAVGGSVGAGLGVKYGTMLANQIFRVDEGENTEEGLVNNLNSVTDSIGGVANKSLELIGKPLKGLATNALDAIKPLAQNFTEPLEGVKENLENMTKPLKDVTKPLESVTKPLESVTKPLESVTKPLESVTKPLESVTKPLESLNPLKIMGRQLDLVTTPLALGAGTFSTLLSGFHFSSIVKPLVEASTTGVLGALGGGIGAYFGSWGLDAIHNLL